MHITDFFWEIFAFEKRKYSGVVVGWSVLLRFGKWV